MMTFLAVSFVDAEWPRINDATLHLNAISVFNNKKTGKIRSRFQKKVKGW